MQCIDCENILYFFYELLILMTGLTFIELSTTIMSNILKIHPNNREFHCYDIVGTLDKQYVLACNHSFVKSGQRIIFF